MLLYPRSKGVQAPLGPELLGSGTEHLLYGLWPCPVGQWQGYSSGIAVSQLRWKRMRLCESNL